MMCSSLNLHHELFPNLHSGICRSFFIVRARAGNDVLLAKLSIRPFPKSPSRSSPTLSILKGEGSFEL